MTATVTRPSADQPNPWDLPDARRNVAWLVLDGFVFALGFNFLSPVAILPAFVARLSLVNVLVSSFVAIDQGENALPQFAISRWAERATLRGRRTWFKSGPNLIKYIPIAMAIRVGVTVAERRPALTVAAVMLGFAHASSRASRRQSRSGALSRALQRASSLAPSHSVGASPRRSRLDWPSLPGSRVCSVQSVSRVSWA
jgi:hypothetical protein